MDRRPGKGTAIVIRESVTELLERPDEFDVTLVHRLPIPEDPLYRRAREIVLPRVRSPKWSGWLSELAFFLTTRERFDIYYFPYSRLYPTFWLAPARRIVWAAMDGGPRSAGFEGPAKRTLPWHTRLFLRSVDAVIAISRFGKRGIVEASGIPEERVHVVYDSLGAPFASPGPLVSPDELASRYGIRAPYLLDVSRFDPHKNIVRVLEAYRAAVADRGLPHRLVFVGGRHMPDYSAEVDRAIDRLGLRDRVVVAPYVDDAAMPAVYAHASGMLFPSLYEGFGLPVIEAMAMRTPVLISSIDALTEVAGGLAEIVDPYDPQAIAAGITRLLEPDAERPRRLDAARDRALGFSRRAHGDALATVFRHVL